MTDEADVLEAAERRATALAEADVETLTALLHPEFGWATHTGQRFDRAAYVERNTGGTTVWRSQTLDGAIVTVVDGTAVLHATAVDVIVVDGVDQGFRMPVTLTWVRTPDGWQCLAGHAGPKA